MKSRRRLPRVLGRFVLHAAADAVSLRKTKPAREHWVPIIRGPEGERPESDATPGRAARETTTTMLQSTASQRRDSAHNETGGRAAAHAHREGGLYRSVPWPAQPLPNA